MPPLDERSALLALVAGGSPQDSKRVGANPTEIHIESPIQLTFGGQNAEAYWSKDGKQIVYQTLQPGYPDEQIFVMNADGSNKRLVSTGKGRCTCSYFSPDGKYVYFSSTHQKNEGAQKKLDMSKGYLWMVNPEFSIYRRRVDGAHLGPIEPVLSKSGYLAETTIDPKGRYMTFTGNFEGDLEIYRADLKGEKVTRLTNEVGYDGGPFVSWDGKKIVYRRQPASTPQTLEEYRTLLKDNLVKPGKLEIWIMDSTGRNKRQVTNLGVASFAPFLLPNGKQIIFSSNYGDPQGREFDLWLINVDGSGLTQVTKTPDFDGFPMVSRDGKKLLWASNRFGKVRGETNVFVADWKG
jgi:Tol biopolymer transport system component